MKKPILPLFLCCMWMGGVAQNCILPILDNEVTHIDIGVNLLGPNDLGSNPLQKVCFTLSHTWIGDLSISLTSPGGQHYLLMADDNNQSGGCGTNADNADVCIVLGANNPLTYNAPYACNSQGYYCLSGDWTVPCGGVYNPITGAQQAPNCDLNDFNVPGQPVNGTWTISVSDVCAQDVGTLENVNLFFASGMASCCGETPGISCADAPLLNCFCLENGYQSTTSGPNSTDQPAAFCGSIENEQWIAFQACWCAVDITIETGDSQMGGGVEAQLYTDCAPFFTPKTNCIAIAPNSIGSFNGISCVPGNTYYLMIDGVNGDTINYTIKVTPVPESPVVITQDTIFGPSVVCAGDTVTYFAPPVLNAGHCWFEFSDNTTELINPNHNGVAVVFGQESGMLCFGAQNCISSDSVCMFIQVDTIVKTITNSLTVCDTLLPFSFEGLSLTNSGVFTYDTLQSVIGCDSFLQVNFQVLPCSSLCPNANFPIAPADSCAAAPPFCASYLNGFCSSNSGYTADVPGNLGQIVPCSIENSQWLQFTTCDSTVQLVLSVTNCASAKGLEFFVLQTTDCQSFESKAACYGLTNGSLDTLTVSGLTVGGTYHLMVDGIDGDICQWEIITTIGVSSGSIYQEENTPGQVTGPTAICAGGTASFTFTSPICDLLPIGGCPPAFQQSCIPQLDTCMAMQYDTIWSVTPAGTVFVNNDSLGLNVTVVFPDTLPISPGGSMDFIVSVKLVSVPGDTLTCPADCTAECLEIIPDTELCGILPLTVTVCMPLNTTEQMAICPGECVDFYGETYCQPGTYMATSIGQCGCVNNHTLLLEWVQEVPPVVSNLTEACDPTGGAYTVSFDVQGFGNPIFVNGQPLTGPTFTSMAMPSGQPYTFLVEMMGICDTYTEVVSGSFTCPPCIGDTIDLGTISLCPSESFPLLGNSYSAPGTYSELLLNPATSCYETYEFILEQIVENQLVVGPVVENCDASNLNYTVEFSIETGTPPYSVNGVLLNGNFYQSGLIQSGQIYDFTVTDAATCDPQQLSFSGSFTCSCASSPGTVGLNVINQCEGEMATASFNNDAVVGPGDLLVFILHTSASNALGSVIGTNATGTFGFVPGLMNFGETYYISPAVGPDQGGTVDYSNVCFSLSPGQPIVFYEKPEVQVLAPDTLTCSLNTLMLNALPSGGSGDFSYEWTGPNGFSATEANPFVSEPGAYLLLLTDNVTGCQAQSGTAVGSDTSLPVFTVTSGEISCQQATAILVAASQLAGVTYTWTFPTGSTVSGDTLFTEIPGDYSVTALGPNGCSADAVTFVLVNGVPPSVSATGGSINCSESTAELSATSNEPTATFTWTLPDSTSAIGATLTASMLGTYTVTVAGANGCTAEASTELVQGPDPDLMTEVEVGDPTCFGYSDGFIKVLGTTGGTAPYEYTLNDTLVEDFFQDLSAGDYLLSTTDSNGCMALDTIQLVDPPEVVVQIGADQFVDFGQSVTLTMQSNITPDSIVWYGPRGEVWPGVNTLTLNPTENGRYTIIISDVNLCRSSDTTYIYINGKGKVFVPTAFSPNRDGVNDILSVYAGGDVEKIIEMQIFDRWGEMVFVQKDFNPNDPVHGWDGRLDGKEMDPGVFVVKVMVLFKDGTKKLLVSDVVLMR